MTMDGGLSCHTNFQKSTSVLGRGPTYIRTEMCDPHGGGYRGLVLFEGISRPIWTSTHTIIFCVSIGTSMSCAHNSMDVSAEEIPSYSFVGIMLTLSGQKLVGCRVAL